MKRIDENGWIESMEKVEFIKEKLNYQTINVFNFINENVMLMDYAKDSETYKDFTDEVREINLIKTKDNVSLSDMDLDYDFLDKFIRCLK